jgi:hypothetical protein
MANEYLQRTPTSTGNRKVWTWAGWIKRSNTAGTNILFSKQQQMEPLIGHC